MTETTAKPEKPQTRIDQTLDRATLEIPPLARSLT